MVELGADLGACVDDGETLLMRAALLDDAEGVRLLLLLGAPVNAVGSCSPAVSAKNRLFVTMCLQL